jgi:hypothetical protein
MPALEAPHEVDVSPVLGEREAGEDGPVVRLDLVARRSFHGCAWYAASPTWASPMKRFSSGASRVVLLVDKEEREVHMLASIDYQQGLEDAWANVVTFAPKLLGFLLILLIGWFIAKLISKLVNGVLERIGFDGWVERGTLATSFQRANTDPSDIVAVIAFWAVFLIALQLAFGIWGPNPISDLIHGILAYLPNVIVAVIILVIAAAVARVVTDVLSAMLGAVPAGEWIARIAGIAILVVGIFAALDQLNVAPAIVTGLFYAILAIVVGSLIVAFGVGSIPVARRYVEQWAARGQMAAQSASGSIDVEAGKEAARARFEEERTRMESSRQQTS